MGLMGAAEVGADAVDELLGGEEPGGLDHGALAVDPLGLYSVRPRALRGQPAGDDAHARAGALDLAVVGADPRPHLRADVPGGVVPDEEQGLLALGRQTVAAPG